jgi:acyl-coenzyme A synthetase/AMP-(fatty) acid ligase
MFMLQILSISFLQHLYCSLLTNLSIEMIPFIQKQYVPLELAYPTPMIERVLADAHPIAICTTLQHIPKLPSSATMTICLNDPAHEEHTAQDDFQSLLIAYQNDWDRVQLNDLAFVVYSSGTTGQPKGIANPHHAPSVSYRWRFDTLSDYQLGDVMGCNVFFVWEALRPLMRGGAVLPILVDDIFDGERLTLLLERFGVTEILFTPSYRVN